MSMKHEIKSRAAIQLFFNRTKNTNNYAELLFELNILNEYINEFAAKKNNRPNKIIVAFSQYYMKEKGNRRDYEKIIKRETEKAVKHKKSYKDYTTELILLKNRGYSLRRISSYAKQHFKIQVSKDTLSKYFKEIEIEKIL